MSNRGSYYSAIPKPYLSYRAGGKSLEERQPAGHEISGKSRYTVNKLNPINTYFNGQREYPVTNGRVHILTGQYAIEVERVEKWKNAIGQALWYGLQTNRKAGIVLLVLDPSEYKYFQMLNSTSEWSDPYDRHNFPAPGS